MKNTFILAAVVSGVSLIGFWSCKKKTESVQFMFVHAMPDVGSVDVYAQDKLVGPGVSYSGNSGYVTVSKKEDEHYKIEIKTTAGGQVLLSATNPVWDDGMKTGMYSYGLAGNASLGRELIIDNYTTPPVGKASVRFIHLASDAPALDLAVNNVVVHANKEFLGSSVLNGFTGFSPVTAGTHDVDLRLAGTSSAVASSPQYNLQEGRSYTVFAKGLLSGSGSQALGVGVVAH